MDTEAVTKLDQALREAAKRMGAREARFLVSQYYQLQERRIATAAQTRAGAGNDEPWELHAYLAVNLSLLEDQIRAALDKYTSAHPVGLHLRKVIGIGPVLAAGFLGEIDITRAPTVGHIWRFAGLDPTCVWEKGTKRPFNADLKVLCWKTGESFIKSKANPRSIYGPIFDARKALERARNDAGEFADQAADTLVRKNFAHDTEAFRAYTAGKLPDGRINARARRYAVKLFLADLHCCMYRVTLGQEPPVPYVLEHVPGHVHRWIASWVPSLASLDKREAAADTITGGA